VNWVKWLQAGNPPTENMVDSLANQARWLRRRLEYHIRGNHLLANAKALCSAGLFFSDREADRWHRKGLVILRREFPEQILPDGGHFERSPMYHLLVLEDLLDLINLHRRYEAKIPQQWHDAVTAMLQWSKVMRHPDGEIPFFNDAAFGIAPEPEAIDDYAQALGFVPPQGVHAPLTHLPQTGYARLERGRVVLFTDAAPVGPDYLLGHAHADTLSFEFSIGDRRVVVNGGTSLYGVSVERDRQRGSDAHSTAVIDDTDSSEVWAGFRVARRARTLNPTCGCDAATCWFQAAHDGYRKLPGRPVHCRQWSLENGCLSIADEVSGEDEHTIDILLPLHPGFTPTKEGDNHVRLASDSRTSLRIDTDSHTKLYIEPTTWHPRFGRSETTWRIRSTWSGALPITLHTRITWPELKNA